ncbi:LolA family protein [Dongia deserti]|uniref:LolA family protein n=1 Tax=Dongia deserti TaxID=2268030 RepID=UPI0013C40A59|nr:outer membrane lipoprotein carrier protein LolA [Dongia deserti]
MKTSKRQHYHMDRRGLLRASAGLVGAAAVGSLLPSMALAQGIQAAQLSESDKADLTRVEDYLNGISSMKASFQQFTQGEGLAFGRIYLRRPGRLRVEYDPPSEILLIADGTLLSYYDAELNHIEQVPLRLSPMWFLLRDNVRLGGDVTVTSFKKAANAILIGMVQSDEPEAGSVLLEFGDKPLELRQWSITDSAGSEVRVGLYNTEFGIPLSAALFATPRKRPRNR